MRPAILGVVTDVDKPGLGSFPGGAPIVIVFLRGDLTFEHRGSSAMSVQSAFGG
jgi:hypothetical protein